MSAKFSARECIPIEYIEEQMREYAKFDHLRANAEFLDWFIKDYKDNAMTNYEWTADTPQTEKTCNNCGRDKAMCLYCEERNEWTPQTDIHGLTDCDFCKEKNCEDCEGGKDEPQTAQKIAEFQKMCGIKIDPDRMNIDCGWK